MRYITLQQAAQQLKLSEQQLIKWAQQGYLTPYVRHNKGNTFPRASSKFLNSVAFSSQMPTVYFLADEVEELAEDLAWSRLGLHAMAHDEDEDTAGR